MNLNRLFDGLMSSGVAGGLAGGAASGLLVQSLGSKKGRKMAGSALKLGGAAVVGGLAWKAYQDYQQKQTQGDASAESRQWNPPPEAGAQQKPSPWGDLPQDAFLPESASDTAFRDLLVLRSMITASHADGHIDEQERFQIYRRIEGLSLSQAEKSVLLEEITNPLSPQSLVAQASTPALAAEIYLAALIAVDMNKTANQWFIQSLEQQLQLPAHLAETLKRQARSPEIEAQEFSERVA